MGDVMNASPRVRVVVTGSECTGKTTLAEALATHYGAPCVPEYVRRFVVEKGSAPEYRDVEAIAHGQVELEDRLAAGAGRLLVQDTDLVSTLIYSRHYYGDCPLWIDLALRERAADLYLLAGIDVPWEADGDQRDRGNRREEMQELFRRALIERGLTYLEIGGSETERLDVATGAIDRLLAS
jgi:NadR type nicotinamide-nucleotide adenylyltransferase